MTVVKSFDLSNLEPSSFEKIAETLRFDVERALSVEVDQGARSVKVEAPGPDAMAFIESFVAGLRRTYKRLPKRVLEEHRAKRLVDHDVDEALAASGGLCFLGDGLVGLRGDLLRLFRFFEREFLGFARAYRADENHYPVMLPIDVLEELGYFTHFPQQVTFCSHLPEDISWLQSLGRSAAENDGRLLDDFRERLNPVSHALKPAVCLPCYRQHRDLVLAEGEVRTLTMQNHVFRYEGSNFSSLARTWDFSVRDLVFFGSYEELTRLRRGVMTRAMELCAELDLEARLELANDPFFLDESKDKTIHQRLGEVKYELLFRLPFAGKDLAVSSFNLHRDYYAAVYNIRQASGELAETACMGFGLERWVYGFLSQKGLDCSLWPERVVTAVAAAEHA